MNHLFAIVNAVLRLEVDDTAEQRPALPPHGADERYLAEATDHADLERRIRVLDREHHAPVMTTFNH